MPTRFDEKSVSQTISERRRILEIVAVVITGVGKFIFMDFLEWRFLYITTAIIAWSIYIFYCKRQNADILKYWGFRTDNLSRVASMVLPFGLISLIAFIVTGHFLNTLNVTWHIVPILIIYPLWGTIQQFLIISLIAGNMKDLKGQEWSNLTIMLATAFMFAVVHYPNVWLIFGTFILALFYTYIFLRNRNVFILGLFHGWLGGIFFYTIVDRDPFLEVFGPLMN